MLEKKFITARNAKDPYADPETVRLYLLYILSTHRIELSKQYLQQHFTNAYSGSKEIAVDIGCGPGWLAMLLRKFGFESVYGIDTSLAMLDMACRLSAKEVTGMDGMVFRRRAPAYINGQCDLVTAVHVHHYFENRIDLQNNFFDAAAKLLKPRGELVVIGDPWNRLPVSDSNSIVRARDIPIHIQSERIKNADPDEWIACASLPPFDLLDGLKKLVIFKTPGQTEEYFRAVTTVWTGPTLVRLAHNSGLELVKQTDVCVTAFHEAKPVFSALHFSRT